MNPTHILWIALGTAAILMIPLIAMQFSEEWDWKPFDFIIIGTLLFGSGLIYEFLATKVRTTKQRVVLGLLVIAAVMAIWAELAVGIFDSLFAGS